jgi:polar amino acid transport system permease protein
MTEYLREGVALSFEKFIGFLPALLEGAGMTLFLTVVSVAAGAILGLFIALGRISKNKILDKATWFYIWLFRGTPLLMQIMFIYYGLPKISPLLTIPGQIMPALLALSLNSAAYLAEIIRAAIQSIDKGQMEAAKALGLTYRQAMKRVIIPQSYRRLIPPVGNELIAVLKDTSLVSTISMTELMFTTTRIAQRESRSDIYLPSAAIYLVMTTLFTYIVDKLEKKYSVYE